MTNSAFTYDVAEALPHSIAPGESTTLTVRFAPTSAGLVEDELVIEHEMSNNGPLSTTFDSSFVRIDIKGTGAAAR